MKLQIKSKARGKGMPKWIPPEKRMKRYRKNVRDFTKVPFTKFVIVVPTETDKEQLLAAFEYIHDNPVIDTDFIVVNQVAHSYLTPEREKGHPDMITVNQTLYDRIWKRLNSTK